MRVRATQAGKAYYPQTCQIITFAEGEEFTGDIAGYLASTGAPVEADPADDDAPVDPAPVPEVETPAEPGPPVEGFDPAEHNGPDVIAYAKDHPEQAAGVFAAERAGKARTTVLAALESLA